MMQNLVGFISFVFLSLNLACGQQKFNAPSQTKVNVSIDTSTVDYAEAELVFDFFKSVATNKSVNEPLSSVIDIVKLLNPSIGLTIENALATKFVNGVDFTCDPSMNKCYGIAQGQTTDVLLKGVSFGAIHDPTMKFSSKIEIKFRMIGTSTLEVCRIGGIKVASGLTSDIDGAYLELDQTTIKSLIVDLGPFGSYPSNNCNL